MIYYIITLLAWSNNREHFTGLPREEATNVV